MNEENLESVVLTEAAARMAQTLRMHEPTYQGKPLRLYLDGKGCDGFYYGVTYDQANEDDTTFDSHGETIVVDPDTLEFVLGSVIDWVDDERGRGFLVDNPRHRKFRGKFYKRKSWQDRLKEKQASHQSGESAP